MSTELLVSLNVSYLGIAVVKLQKLDMTFDESILDLGNKIAENEVVNSKKALRIKEERENLKCMQERLKTVFFKVCDILQFFRQTETLVDLALKAVLKHDLSTCSSLPATLISELRNWPLKEKINMEVKLNKSISVRLEVDSMVDEFLSEMASIKIRFCEISQM